MGGGHLGDGTPSPIRALRPRLSIHIRRPVVRWRQQWLEEIKSEGLLQAQVVELEFESGETIRWTGFRPDLIEKFLTTEEGEAA